MSLNIVVTGGAGLVGNSITKLLLSKNHQVTCIDNFSLGTANHIKEFESNKNYSFFNKDLKNSDWDEPLRSKKWDLMIHLAANSDISLGHQKPEMDFERTFLTTFNALQSTRRLGIKDFIFSSTSAVYGANPPFPSPENSPELHPVSIYGSGKLASEAYISSFVENYGLNAWVYRFGNVVGEKLTHGVIYDFVRKLQKNDFASLEVLGNGMQTKTYIDVDDCVKGIWTGYEKSKPLSTDSHAKKFQIFNLSTEGATSVKTIAEKCVEIITQNKAKIHYGTEPIGWVGDVPKTLLATNRILSLGWKPSVTSTEAVINAIKNHFEWFKNN